jgi:hypothetical protein
MSEQSEQNNAVDAVVTWVDGNDPVHRKKRAESFNNLSSESEYSLPTGRDKTRFLDNGELRYCIESIRTFAPWIRTIHIITDNQVPEFVTPDFREQYKIKIVDHTDIFKSFEWALPNFNSRTIETALWRTPGLAPRFIYFNDDFIITKKVNREDFFTDNMVILRGSWKPIRKYGTVRMELNNMISYFAKHALGITRSMHLLLQIRSAELAGFSRQYYRAPHVPHPIHTQTLKTFFDKNPSHFEENIRFQFRNMDQFSAIHLANHLEIQQQKAVLTDESDTLMINGEMDFSFLVNKKLKKLESGEVKFLCLQGFENFSKKERTAIEKTVGSVLNLTQKTSGL